MLSLYLLRLVDFEIYQSRGQHDHAETALIGCSRNTLGRPGGLFTVRTEACCLGKLT